MTLDGAHLDELAGSLVDSHDKLMTDLIGMRKRHRLTQEQVAERMSVSQPTVASFERYDANPTLATIRRYALAVGASIEHRVDDRCCAPAASDFEAVVAGVEIEWDRAANRHSWAWPDLPMVVRTYG